MRLVIANSALRAPLAITRAHGIIVNYVLLSKLDGETFISYKWQHMLSKPHSYRLPLFNNSVLSLFSNNPSVSIQSHMCFAGMVTIFESLFYVLVLKVNKQLYLLQTTPKLLTLCDSDIMGL